MAHVRTQLLVAVVIFFVPFCFASPALGAEGELVKAAPSLQWVPADAAFYTTSLRMREQIEAIGRSRGWAALKGLPVVQALWHKARQQMEKPESPLGSLWQFYQLPENRQLLEVLADMASEEIFFYGDNSWAGFVQIVGQTYGSAQYGSLLMQLTGQAKGVDAGKLQALNVLNALNQNVDKLKIPSLIMGFKVHETAHAQAQIKRLEKHLESAASQHAQLKGRFKWEMVGGAQLLTLALDGSMVPWQQIPFADLEKKPGQFDKLREKLTALKLTISIGIKDQYLLFAIGESTEPVARLGAGSKLADRPELKRLAPFASQRITSISYLSQELHAEFATKKKDIDQWIATANQYLKDAGLPEEVRARARKDLGELAKDLKVMVPEVGASLSCSFLTDRGQESYAFEWGEHLSVDSSKPLSLLNHCGGNPILAVVSRSKFSPENYRLLVKWLKVMYGYVDDLVVPRLDDDKKAQYEQFTKIAFPLLARFDKATGEMLLPALAEGQFAFVLDAKIASKQWIRGIPANPEALPMLEPAIVLGVSDAALLRRAMGEYRSIANDAIARVREVIPIVPALELPEPETKKVAGGTLYFYEVPAFLGLDPQITPNAGVSARVAVLALSQQHSERLLTKTPLRAAGGPLADLNRPLAGAVYFDWPAAVDAATPWVDFGLRAAGPNPLGGLLDESADEAATSRNQGENLRKQVHTLLSVLKALQSTSSATYLEEGVLVTHRETTFKDL